MRKSLILCLGAGVALSSAFVAQGESARVTKAVTTSGVKASEARVTSDGAAPASSPLERGLPVNTGRFFTPIATSGTIETGKPRTAKVPRRALKASTQLIGYLNSDADGLTSSTFYTIPVGESNEAGDFKVKAKYSNAGPLVAGAYYNVEDYTVIAPRGEFIYPMPDYYDNWITYSFKDLRKFDLENAKMQINDDMFSFGDAYAVGGVATDATQPGKAYGFYGWNDNYDPDEWMLIKWQWGCLDYDKVMSDGSVSGNFEPIKTRIQESEKCYFVCADNEGQYYGINGNGELRKIDKATGDQTVIGQTQVDVEKEKGGATFNPNTGTMVVYTINGDNTGSTLYEVDLATGATTVAATYPTCWDFAHLVIFPSLAEDKAPNTPGLHITAPAGSRTIEYVVELPATLYDATQLTGDVKWEITANGKVILEGEDPADSSVGGTYTFATEDCGQTEFICVAKNDAGPSPKAKQSLFVGPGLPGAPKDIFAIHNNGKVTLKWAKPKTGEYGLSADGGPIDIDNMEYVITDTEGNVKTTVKVSDCGEIAGTYSTTYLTTSFDEPYSSEEVGYFSYTIAAVNDGRTGKSSDPFVVPVGVRDTPFSLPKEEEPSLGELGLAQPVSNLGNWYKGADSPAINVYTDVDAWLFLPALRLVGGGKIHNIDFDINGSNNKMVPLEIYVGTDNTPEAMTTQVMELTGVAPVSYGNLTHYRHGISVENDGVYYVGFHVKSGNAGNWISVENLTVSEGMYGDAPGAYTISKVTRDAQGENKFKTTVKLPTFTTSGEEMTEKFTTEVLVDGEIVKTYSNNCEPGASYSLEGTVKEAGEHTIGVRGVRNGHAGPMATMTAYVGPLAYEAPANVNIFPGSPDGNVTLSWNPVVNDIDGVAQPEGTASYMVYSYTVDTWGNIEIGEPMLKAPVTTTYATFKAVEPGNQQFVQYLVGAFNRGVEPTQFTGSPVLAAGTPYALPVKYSHVDDLERFIAAAERYLPGATREIPSNEVYFTPIADGQFEDISSSDNDGVFFASYSKYASYGNDFVSGVIDLKGITNPQVLLDVHKMADDDVNILQVLVRYDGQEEVVYSTDKSELSNGWNTVALNFTPYIGRNMQVVVRNITKKYVWNFFDNLRVVDRKTLNLSVYGISAPKYAKTGNEFQVKATVENIGIQPARDFTVSLLRDGKEIDSRVIDNLSGLKSMNVAFDTKIDLFDDNSDEATYAVKVALAGDEDSGDDLSGNVTVERRIYNLPTVTDLVAEPVDGDVRLTWSPYVHDPSAAVAVIEDFEGEVVAHGDNEFGDWTFVDMDGQLIGGVYINGQELEIPNHKGLKDTGSFFIWDWDDPSVPAGSFFTSVSGSKMIVSMYTVSVDEESERVYAEKSDDWAISPLLSGNAQTISFQARPFEVHSQEIIEVYYSTEDSTDPASFVKVGDAIKLQVNGNMLSNEGDWEKHSFDVPEGAKRFAIRVVSKDGFMCCIDDVEFESAGGTRHELLGYDVYRDGVMVTEDAVGESLYTDEKVEAGSHTYHVVANYIAGRSELSNPAYVNVSGVAGVAADGVSVKVVGKEIVVTAPDAAEVSVAAADGRTVYLGEGSAKVKVLSGIYLVKAGELTVKVMVK